MFLEKNSANEPTTTGLSTTFAKGHFETHFSRYIEIEHDQFKMWYWTFVTHYNILGK